MNSENQTDALREDIDVTRQRMDNTIDSLGERLQPRHLVDEVLGWFRGESADGDSRLSHLREKVTTGANQAVRSTVETVKANPLPALVIGAGIAWMIYESQRDKSSDRTWSRSASDDRGPDDYDPDVYSDRPLQYPSDAGNGDVEGSSKLENLKD
jgi:hypothetical protein